MKHTLFYAVVALFCCLYVCGCGGQRRPSDLPKLYPCKVTVTYKGAPVEGASITFSPTLSKWAGNGLTGADGTAMLKTYGYQGGVPAGTYKVRIEKYDQIHVSGSGEEAVYDEKLIFDEKFSNDETTPFEFTVEAKNLNEATFEVE